MKKRALISVSDKRGVVEFAKAVSEMGFEIISTGGTATVLSESGVDVIPISQITGFPECLDGRVKTLHPNIHGGILAIRDNIEHMRQLEQFNINTIDIVAINLYPFKETIQKDDVTLAEAIENIDIGGPSMLRAAAKNYRFVTVITEPSDYDVIVSELREKGVVSEELRLALAAKVFEHTSAYDTLIAGYLGKQKSCNESHLPTTLTLTFEKVQDMRYGENPHQFAAFYKEAAAKDGLHKAVKLHGKELSFNNINDANGALELLNELGGDMPAAVAVKHANPCGAGLGETLHEAYINAYEADPVSIFGGIVALNRIVDFDTATELAKTFLEIIIAPDYDQRALELLMKKKNIRLLKIDPKSCRNVSGNLDIKKVSGGLLIQNSDVENIDKMSFPTNVRPNDIQLKQLDFAWRVVKHVKSNGIAIVKGNRTIGIGPGQTNRITALELALKYSGEHAQGAVLASDGFFPFDDCVKAAAKAGISAIIQPGGSVNDEISIKACDELGIAMVLTGMRHFKH